MLVTSVGLPKDSAAYTVQIKPGRRVTRHKALLPPNFGPLSLVTGPATACDTPQDPLFGRYTATLGNFSPPAAAMSQATGPPAAPPDRIDRVTARTPRRPGLIYTVPSHDEDWKCQILALGD